MKLMTAILKIFFHLLYHRMAWLYDFVAWLVSGGRWKEWVRVTTGLIDGQDILELGCGTGTLQIVLATDKKRVSGIDESAQMLRIARKGMIKNLRHVSPGLCRARAENIPFPNSSMDMIVATFPSEYIVRPESLESIRRVLRQGGKLIVLLGVDVRGLGLYDRFLRFIYHFTGQRTPDPSVLEKELNSLREFGFEGKYQQIWHGNDRLTFLIALRSCL